MYMEQKLQELQEKIKVLEQTLIEINTLLNKVLVKEKLENV
jgi:hypothetical protein